MAPRARLRGAEFNIAFDKLPHIYPHFADYMHIVVGPVPLIAIKIHRSMMGGPVPGAPARTAHWQSIGVRGGRPMHIITTY